MINFLCWPEGRREGRAEGVRTDETDLSDLVIVTSNNHGNSREILEQLETNKEEQNKRLTIFLVPINIFNLPGGQTDVATSEDDVPSRDVIGTAGAGDSAGDNSAGCPGDRDGEFFKINIIPNIYLPIFILLKYT